MGFRNIYILNPSKLSIKNEQLVIQTDEVRSIPLEDIETIVLDNLYVNLSAFALMKCCEYGITLYISNKSHIPAGVFLPQGQHSRHLQVLKAQIQFSKPKLKRIWQQIIISKIKNQAKVLQMIECDKHHELDSLAKKVRSGDSDNIESVAAAAYFKFLFGRSFTRGSEDIINIFLNYGYAILRSTIAKKLCVYGFEPSLGIFHHNTFNNFNLADDIIESYRPIIDLYVISSVSEETTEFSSIDRANLVNILNYNIKVDNQNFSVAYAIEKIVKSLSSIINGKDDKLMLPEIVPLRLHSYE